MEMSSLTGQIEAISIVDKLRFENVRLQGYMNTASEKAKLVEKIAASYRTEGTSVSISVINEGIEQWYKQRLVFRDIDTPWFFSAYIRREKWLKPALYGTAAFVLRVMLVSYLESVWHGSRLRYYSKTIDESVHILASGKPVALSSGEISTNLVQENSYPIVKELLLSSSKTNAEIKSLQAEVQVEADSRRLDITHSAIPNVLGLNDLVSRYQALVTISQDNASVLKTFINQVSIFGHLRRGLQEPIPMALKESIAVIETMLYRPMLTLQD